MKLHLPKRLLTALIAAFAAHITVSADEIISVNFGSDTAKHVITETASDTLKGESAGSWNNIVAGNAAGVTGEHILKSQIVENGVAGDITENAATLILSTNHDPWGPGGNSTTLTSQLQAGYLDCRNDNETQWVIDLDVDHMLVDFSMYFSGDGGKYNPITVNGQNYVGGTDKTGDAAWGDRAKNASATLGDHNTITVTNIVGGSIYAANVASTSNRSSISGFQVVLKGLYEADLASGDNSVATLSFSKNGSTSTLQSIAAEDRYLSLSADDLGSSLNVMENVPENEPETAMGNVTIAGLQLTANNLTVWSDSGVTLTTGMLHAKAGSELDMGLKLVGSSLTLSGKGVILLGDMAYTEAVTVASATTVQLKAGSQSWGSFVNAGTVVIDETNRGLTPAAGETLSLNSVLNPLQGETNNIQNESTGVVKVSGSSEKSLSGKLTLKTGGKVVLTGGSFGSETSKITSQIETTNSTVLGFEKIQAYIGSNSNRVFLGDLEVGADATLHLYGTDALAYDGKNYKVLAGGVVELHDARQSLGTSKVILAGGTIRGTGGVAGGCNLGLDFYNGGTLEVTADGSRLETNVGGHNNGGKLTFSIGDNCTLTMTGDLVSKGTYEKNGAGSMLYQGAAFTPDLSISGGEFVYEVSDARTHDGTISGSATFTKSGTGTLTLDSSKTSVTNLKVNAGELIYNSTTDTSHTLAGAAGSTFTKDGSGTLTVSSEGYAGDIDVSSGILKFDGSTDSTTNNSSRKITVQDGAQLDLNGKARHYKVELNQGATLTNTGDATGYNQRQLHTITLNGDATVSGTGDFYLINDGYTTTYLDLNQHKLTKTGTNTFYLKNTTVQSAGVIRVEEGTVQTLSSGEGTLDISKASVEIANGGSFVLAEKNQQIQNLTLEGGGTLTVNSGYTLTTMGDVTWSGGTISGSLCLNGTVSQTGGTVDLSHAVLSGTSILGFTEVSVVPQESGLYADSYKLIDGETVSVKSTQATITVGSKVYSLDTATGIFSSTENAVYYVAKGDTIIAGGDNAAEGTGSAVAYTVVGTLNIAADVSASYIKGEAGTVTVDEGKTLTLSSSSVINKLEAGSGSVALEKGTLILGNDSTKTISSIGTLHVGSGSVIHLNSMATLQGFAKAEGSSVVTIGGSGVFDIGDARNMFTYSETATNNQIVNNNQSYFRLADDWTGTVLLSGAKNGANDARLGLNLHNLSNANSAVELKGVSGFFTNTMEGKLILTKQTVDNNEIAAWTVTNGNTSNTYVDVFNGAIEGAGTLRYKASVDTGFKFAGDIKNWTGSLDHASANRLNIYLEGDADDVRALIKKSGSGALNLKVNTTDAATFTKAVTVSDLDLQQSATFTDVLSATSISVAAGKTLTLNNGTSHATQNGSVLVSATGSGNITLSADAIVEQNASSHATGNLTIQGGATLAIATEGKVHDTIKGQNYDLSSFTSVTLNNATIKYVGSTTELQNVTVETGGASLLFRDMGAKVDHILGSIDNGSWYKLTGTTTLEGDLTISKFTSGNAWKYAVSIDKLTGDGALNVSNGSEHGYVRVNDVSGYTGAISVTKSGGDPAAVALRNLSGELGISGITLANGAEIYMVVAENASAEYSGSLSGSGTLRVSGGALTISGSNGSAYTGSTDIAEDATLTIKNRKSLGSWNSMTKDNVLGRVTGSGTLIIDFESADTQVSAKGAGNDSSLGGFTGTVDIRQGQLYVGNNPNEGSNHSGDFGASRVIVRDGAQFWTHSTNSTIASAFDLVSGATLGNKDGNKEYTGTIRFNVVDPYAEEVTYKTDGSVTLNQEWRKDLVYSGKLEGSGTVLMRAPWRETGIGTFKLTNNENSFSGRYKLADSASNATADRGAKLILGGETVAQYAEVELAGTSTISQLVLNQSSTIKGLYGDDADNIVTVEGDTGATLTVSKGNFGGKLQDGSSATLGLMKTGADKLTLSGANISYTGLTTLAGGELEITGTGALSGGLLVTGTGVKLTQSGDGGILGLAGGISVDENASAEFAGNVSIGSTIRNSGELTLTGQISLTGALTNFTKYGNTIETYVQADGSTSKGENGFLKANGGYWLTSESGTTNLTITEGTTTVKHGDDGEYHLYKDDGDEGETNTGNYYFLVDSVIGTVFYVNANDETTGNVEVNAAAAAYATAYELAAGTTMKLAEGASTAANATIKALGASTIDLAAGSTLHAFTKEGNGAITLTGSGTYDLGSGIISLATGISLGSSWDGTVKLSDVVASGMNFETYGNASSKVALNGVSGWFDRGSNNNVHIILEEKGLTFTDFSTDDNYTFGKGISGTGNFVIDAKDDTTQPVTADPTIRIGTNEDASLTWSGKFQVNDIRTDSVANPGNAFVRLYLNGDGSYFDSTSTSAGVEMNDSVGTLKVFVGHATGADNAKEVTEFTPGDGLTTVNGVIKNNSTGNLELTALNNAVFNKDVTVTSMTVNEGKTATMNATLKAGTVTNNGELKLSDKATITGGTMSKVQMDSAGITGTASGASLSGAQVDIERLAEEATFTIEDMTLTNTTITAASVNSVKFSNVTVTGHTVLKMQAAMQMAPVVGMGGSAVSFETSSYSGITLNTAVADNTLAVDLGDLSCLTPMGPGQYELSITLNGLQFSTDYAEMAAGSGVLFTQDSWLGKLLEGQGATQFVADAETGAPVGSGGGGVSVSYSAAAGGSNVGTIITITGLNVPEPTTATLSLLALAALAARRRRNA